LAEAYADNFSGVIFDFIVILFMAWSVKENYDE